MNDDAESQHLLRQATGGDHAATAELLVLHGDRLVRRLETRLRLNPFADFSADDVLQEVFVDVFKGIITFDVERGVPFTAWLDRVADNRLAIFFRDRGRSKRGGGIWRLAGPHNHAAQLIDELGDQKAGTPSEHLASHEARQAISLCVASLPDEQREAVQRYYLKQEALSEIAQAMGTTKERVRGLIYRARQTMRGLMGTTSRWFRR